MLGKKATRGIACAVLSLALIPGVAFASTASDSETLQNLTPWNTELDTLASGTPPKEVQAMAFEAQMEERKGHSRRLSDAMTALDRILTEKIEKSNKVLSYDRAYINRIGTQSSTGHRICCPSFACAYGDAVLDGTVNSHTYYTCGCCTWPNWGGGGSSWRNLGSSQAVLREAYDQISQGKPTVVHVRASYGEHWITLIGYEGAGNPDSLSLSNFIALDPWDGAEINAASRFRLYGDNIQHISTR